MRIYLIGYMGSGKSTLGKALADALAYKHLDTDLRIEELLQKSIAEIFETEGEIYFRGAESDILKGSFLKDDIVISTGGGLPAFELNMEAMNHEGLTVFLQVSVPVLLDRLKSDNRRPLLQNKDNLSDLVNEHLKQRLPYYERSHLILNGEQTTEQLVAQIVAYIQEMNQEGHLEQP